MSNKKKAIIVTTGLDFGSFMNTNRIYTPYIMDQLKEKYDVCETILRKSNLEEYKEIASKAEYIFSTWGIECFTEEEIDAYFPKAECLFYGAGSVKEFAPAFLDKGIRVFSAWQANAVPVAEFAYAQILLATKGAFIASLTDDREFSDSCGGNFLAKIGIIGVGAIGRRVAERLVTHDVEVLYYDPYFSKEKAAEMGIKECSLEEMFRECDVISNHLPNLDELTGVLSAELFASMKPYASFINTGRGRQVDHDGLLKAMTQVPTRSAFLDVTDPEPLPKYHGLLNCKNVFITPHIAGSNGREVVRMAQYMVDEAARVDKGEAPLYEVTKEMLKTMA